MTKPFIIGIMGPSCSGKTTICERLAQSFPATVMQMDWYYHATSTFKTKHGYPNAEDSSCIDFVLLASHICLLQEGKEINFTTVRKGEHVHIWPASVIVVEGFLLFCDPEVRDMMDLRVFIDIPEEEVVRRKIARARSALSLAMSNTFVCSPLENIVCMERRCEHVRSCSWMACLIPSRTHVSLLLLSIESVRIFVLIELRLTVCFFFFL